MGIYQTLFQLIQTHIYGGVELTADMNLVATLVATAGSLFVFALPFYVVLKAIRLL